MVRLGNLVELGMGSAPKLCYHNFEHEFEAFSAARGYAVELGLSYEERFCLESGALIHDHIVIPGRTNNEIRTAEFMRGYLPGLGYSSERVEMCCDIIMATVMPQNPGNYLGELMCDCDLDNLGRECFFDKGELLRKELGLPYGLGFLKFQLDFICGHEYFTDIARTKRDDGKALNIKKLESMIRNFGE